MVDGARHIKSNKVTRSVPAYSAVKGEKTPIVPQIVLVHTAENNAGILFERQKHLWEIDLFVFFFLLPGSCCGCQNKVLIRKLGMNLLFWIEIFPK